MRGRSHRSNSARGWRANDWRGDIQFIIDLIGEDLAFAVLAIHAPFDHNELFDLHQAAEALPGAGEHDQVDNALRVFDGDEGHHLALLRGEAAKTLHQAGDANFLVTVYDGKLAGEMCDHRGEFGHHRIERVIGHVKADQLAFPVEPFAAKGFVLAFGESQHDFGVGPRAAFEEGELAHVFGVEVRRAHGNDLVEHFEDGVAAAQRVQRAGFGEIFQGTLAHLAQVNAAGQIHQTFKGLRTASSQNGFYGAPPYVLDGAQAKADSGALGQVLDGKAPHAGVDVGRQNGYAHAAAIGHVEGDLVCVAQRHREQRSHVFDGVMQFEIGGLHSQRAVIGGVGLVETVAGEVFPIFKNGVGSGLFDALLHRALHEFLAMFL